MRKIGRLPSSSGPHNTELAAELAREAELIAVGELKPHPLNPRTHSKKQTRQIAESIKRFGFQGVLIINGRNVVLAGHGRLEAVKLLGLHEVPCLRVKGLSDAEERAFVIADNKIAANAGWDRQLLAETFQQLLIELPELGIPLTLDITGFETAEVDAILLDHAESDEEPADEDFELPRSPVTRRGDLWQLGANRLFCGDARDSAVYDRLLRGRLADMAITDPPYNVKVTGHVGGRGKTKHDEFAFGSGEMSGRQYQLFLARSLRQLGDVCKAGALLYIFIDWRHVEVVCEVGRVLGFSLRNICVWSKTTPGQGSFYRSAHELIAVFQKPGASSTNNIALGKFGRSRTNVWTFAAPNKFKGADDPLAGHPTPKPVPMIAEAIKDATPRSGAVLDCFLGSGTTILAAEKVGRSGFGIEYEPAYCDLTIKRWQAYTGKDAILASSGRTFAETAGIRAASPVRPPAAPSADIEGQDHGA